MRQDKKLCVHCGNLNPSDYGFCSECGEKLMELTADQEKPKDVQPPQEEKPKLPKKSKKGLWIFLSIFLLVALVGIYLGVFSGIQFYADNLEKAVLEDLAKDSPQYILEELKKDKDLTKEDLEKFNRVLQDKNYRKRLEQAISNKGDSDLQIVKEKAFFVLPDYKVKIVPVEWKVDPKAMEVVKELKGDEKELKAGEKLYPGMYKISYKVVYPLEAMEPEVVSKEVFVTNLDFKESPVDLVEDFGTFSVRVNSSHAKLVYKEKELEVKEEELKELFLKKGLPIAFQLETPGGKITSEQKVPQEGVENTFEMQGVYVGDSDPEFLVSYKGSQIGKVGDFKEYDYFVGPSSASSSYTVSNPKEDKSVTGKNPKSSKEKDSDTRQEAKKEEVIQAVYQNSIDQQYAVDHLFSPPFTMIYPGSPAEEKALESIASRRNSPSTRFVLTKLEIDEDSIEFFEQDGHSFVRVNQYTYYFKRTPSGDGSEQVAKWSDILIFNTEVNKWQFYSASTGNSIGPNRRIMRYNQ